MSMTLATVGGAVGSLNGPETAAIGGAIGGGIGALAEDGTPIGALPVATAAAATVIPLAAAYGGVKAGEAIAGKTKVADAVGGGLGAGVGAVFRRLFSSAER